MREKTQINKIRDDKGDIITNTIKIQRITREYISKISNKLDNLEEMDKFLDAHDLPKLIQEDVNHLHRSIMSNEIEVVIVSPQGKAQEDYMDPLLNSTRHLKN
jgi:Glu-tRNA(Gln) amidotransferase subunit E-like FAD-binding protein